MCKILHQRVIWKPRNAGERVRSLYKLSIPTIINGPLRRGSHQRRLCGASIEMARVYQFSASTLWMSRQAFHLVSTPYRCFSDLTNADVADAWLKQLFGAGKRNRGHAVEGCGRSVVWPTV